MSLDEMVMKLEIAIKNIQNEIKENKINSSIIEYELTHMTEIRDSLIELKTELENIVKNK